MKNLKRFDEFDPEMNEAGYYGSYASRGSYGYEPPSALGGFKDTFGQGKGLGDLFGAGGALSRDRANKPDINKGIASVKKNIKDRWSQKKGFVDHLMGKGGSPKSDDGDDGGSATGSATRLKGSGTAAAAGAGAAAAAASTPSGGGTSSSAPQTPAPPSVPTGYGISTTDGRWKGLVNALSSITPPPSVKERSSSIQGLPGGKVSEIRWHRFWLKKGNVKNGDKFPLWVTLINYDVVGDRGKMDIHVDIDGKNSDSPQDMAMAEQIDDYWRNKGYQVSGPKKDVGGSNRSTPSKYAIASVYYDIKNPGALKSDLEQLIRKYV